MKEDNSETTTDGDETLLPRMVLSERIKEFITEAILTGEYKPGERIVESALARRLGVSQSPVREAIRDLVAMGFLEAEPYKGTTVRSFSPQELWEVYTVRAALESLAARLAAQRLTEPDIKKLQSILDEMTEAVEEQDQDKMIRVDNRFHETILQISGNKLLYQLWKRLEFGRWTIVTYRMGSYEPEYLALRHEELLDALKTRDPEQAIYAMQHHLEDLGAPPDNIVSDQAAVQPPST